MCSARVTHIPTGIVKKSETRSRQNSVKEAMSALNDELDKLATKANWQYKNAMRQEQVGTGERSDKRRTIRFQDGFAIDHITGKRVPTDVYMKGGMDKLW